MQSGLLRLSDNRRQEKVRRNSSVSLSLIKQSFLGSWSLGVHVHVCHVRWDCTFAMLSRLVCRNGLHKHDFWEIIKSKIRHSYEAHTYLRRIGFASWFQRTESLFGGNWANGPSVRDKCPWQRTQHINVWRMVRGNMHTLTRLLLTVHVGHNVETKSRTYTDP